jgi:hypothetical protein
MRHPIRDEVESMSPAAEHPVKFNAHPTYRFTDSLKA